MCLRDSLKLSPRVISVEAYVPDKGGVVIEYRYRSGKGTMALTDLRVSGPNSDGRFQYVGAFMDSLDDPVTDMTRELASKCQADGYYVDQVLITRPSQRATLPN